MWHADVLARGGFTLLSIVLGTVGTVASIAGLIAALRRRPESARRARKIATVRFWRSGTYHLAFDQLGELIKRWENQDFDPRNRRGFVTEFDLVRWIIQLALTCAASVVPQSLGKASLFRIGEIQRDEQARIIRIRVYSFELDGIFSAQQMLDDMDPRRMRDISIALDHREEHGYPAALQCVQRKAPIVQSLRKRASKFDDPERQLGLTHILAIPLRRDLSDALPDQPVSITVDMRFGHFSGYLLDRFHVREGRLLRRGSQLSEQLAHVKALHRSEFLPPPAPDRT